MDKSVTPMPFFGWMVQRSENMDWWKGQDVKTSFSLPMRLPISGIYNKIFFVQLSAGASKVQRPDRTPRHPQVSRHPKTDRFGLPSPHTLR